MKGNETKQKLLNIGLDQTSLHGVSGVTLGRLASAAGLSKSGIFAHFRSKEQLQLDLLAQMKDLVGRVVVEPAIQVEAGLSRLSAFFDLWLGWSSRAGLKGGCPVAAALFEYDDMEGVVRAEAQVLEEQWRDFLGQLVREAVSEGHLVPETDVEQFVWEICGIYLAHHVSSRFLRNESAACRAKAAFGALVRRHQVATDP